jgi:hypothetical protein
MFGISAKVKLKIISLNGRWFVATGPVSPDPGRDEDPAGRPGEPDVPEGWRELSPSREDWLTEDEWVAWLSRIEPEEWADAGEDDRFPGTTDDELTGLLCALDRAEAAACALKHAVVAELIRRRPGPASEPALAAPGSFEEFTATELSWALADTRWAADSMLDLAQTLTARLPGTYAAFRSGILRQSKVEIIARAVAHLDPDEARAAEALVLDRAGHLPPVRTHSATEKQPPHVARSNLVPPATNLVRPCAACRTSSSGPGGQDDVPSSRQMRTSPRGRLRNSAARSRGTHRDR